MAVIRKFLFETDFDDSAEASLKRALESKVAEPEPEPEAEPPPPPEPTFTEEQLNAARDQAFAAGRTAGAREAEAATQRQLAAAMQAIATNLQTLAKHQMQQAETNHRDAVRVALAVAERVLPDMAARHAMDEIAALFSECMSFLLEEPRVSVKVSEALLDEARQRLEPIAEGAGFEGRLLILGDAGVKPGDCRIEWPQGGAERTMTRLWQDIKLVLERALGAEAIPSEQELETV